MSIFTRFMNVVRGWFGLQVADFEKQNLEESFEHLLMKKRDDIVKFRNSIRDVQIEVERLKNAKLQKEELFRENQSMLEMAVQMEDSENGIILLKKSKVFEEEIQSLDQKINVISTQLDDFNEKLKSMEASYHDLKRKKEEAIRNKNLVEIIKRAQAMDDVVSNDPNSELMENLREESEKLEAGLKVDLDSGQNSEEAKLKGYKEAVEKNQLQDELKKMIAKKKQADQKQSTGKNL